MAGQIQTNRFETKSASFVGKTGRRTGLQ